MGPTWARVGSAPGTWKPRCVFAAASTNYTHRSMDCPVLCSFRSFFSSPSRYVSSNLADGVRQHAASGLARELHREGLFEGIADA